MTEFYGNCPEDSLIGEKHMFQNTRHILENPGINLLYGKFAGKPAIVCASGPSLSAELPLLKTLQDQALILSAESTFWALKAHGIRPHIMCTLERVVRPTGYFDKFSYEDVQDTYLATVPVVPPYMYESYLGPKINVYRNFNHFRWLPFDKGILDIKQSSANMAFKLAHMLGCSPIILLGQDLCFDRDTQLTHVQEHHFGANQAQYHEQKHIDVPANDGQTALTSAIWQIFLDGYVIDVRDYGGDVINCSAKGAYIEGTRYLPFSQAAANYLREPFDAGLIIRKALQSFTIDTISSDLNLLHDKIDVSIEELSAMAEICAEGVQLINGYAEHFQEALIDLDIPVKEQHILREAHEKISALKTRLMSSDTFTMLVVHVIQSYVIAFEMNLNEDHLSLKTDESIKLYTIIKHREYFAALASMLDMIKHEVENAGKITQDIMESGQADPSVFLENNYSPPYSDLPHPGTEGASP
jgi:hypothetical protein